MVKQNKQLTEKHSYVWIEMRRRSKNLEIGAITGIAILVVVGFICDCFVRDSHPLLSVENYTSYILTIIQIQVTVGTLIFTIIALIAGNMSESYKGVSISDYYLNIKPWILTQKILIIILLFFCLGESILYVFHFYNTIFFMFVATLIVILVSILDIYSAFEGRNKYKDEIDAYLEYMIEIEVRHDKGEELFHNFVKDWTMLNDPIDQQSYDEYKRLFIKFMKLMCRYNSDDSLRVLQKQSYIVTYHFLGSAMIESKIQGMDFLKITYEDLWNFIFNSNDKDNEDSKDKENFDHFQNGFFLFAEVYEVYRNAIKKLSIEDLQTNFKFDDLIDLVLRMDVRYKDDNDKITFDIECGNLNSLARSIGRYLKKQNSSSFLINQNLWMKQYDQLRWLYVNNVPENRREEFLKAYASVFFFYSYGLIESGLEDIVINGMYLNIMKMGVDHQFQVFFYLSLHTFMYYLAIRGENDCISSSLRNSALKILKNNEVKLSFENFLESLSKRTEWMNIKFLKQIQDFLRPLELFPSIGLEVKWLMMDTITTEFYLFIALYLNYHYFPKDLLEHNIDEQKMWLYVSNGHESSTKKMLTGLYKTIIDENVKDETINMMYDSLEKVIKEKRKRRLINEAESNQKAYEGVNTENLINDIKEKLNHSFQETFKSIYDQSLENEKKETIDLMNLNTTTNLIFNTDILKGQYSYLNARLLLCIAHYLNDLGVISTRDRKNDFVDDVAYMRYLKDNNISILMGDENVLTNQSYNMYKEFHKYLEQFETQFLPNKHFGIGLEYGAVQLNVNSIDVSITSSNLKDEGIRYDAETNKYLYDASGITIDFDKKEINDFVYNDYKTVHISASISIKVNKKCCGTLFLIDRYK